MTAAKNLADQGYEVHLLEKENTLGGQANHLFQTFQGESVEKALVQMTREIEENQKIHLHMNTELKNVSGFVGNFISTLGSGDETLELEHGVAIVATGGP